MHWAYVFPKYLINYYYLHHNDPGFPVSTTTRAMLDPEADEVDGQTDTERFIRNRKDIHSLGIYVFHKYLINYYC